MQFKIIFSLLLFCSVSCAQAQKDSALNFDDLNEKELDALFAELDGLFDSITKPKTFGSVSLMAANRLLNMSTTDGGVDTKQALLLSPSVGFYHKSGLGITGTAAMFFKERALQPAQYVATASYDLVQLKGWTGGAAFTRFFNPATVDYYTSPLKNEASSYVAYRKSWLKPSLAVSYGWGSRTEVMEEKINIKLRKKTVSGGINRIETIEKVSDWVTSFSVRHDFYHFGVFSKSDHFRFTPQLSLSGGTQRWGFNQTSNAYLVRRNGSFSKPYTSEQISLEQVTRPQLLSLTAFLRTAYTSGKFFVQPQLAFDYYFPETDRRLTTTFMLNTGVLF